jgi:hypothetical protein
MNKNSLIDLISHLENDNLVENVIKILDEKGNGRGTKFISSLDNLDFNELTNQLVERIQKRFPSAQITVR